MALITCPECGKEYSNLAAACPNCGCPTIKPTTTKKIVVNHAHSNRGPKLFEVVESESSIKHIYHTLPTIPRCFTKVLIGLISLFLVLVILLLSTNSLLDTTSSEIMFVFFLLSIELIAYIAILYLKKWGLYLYAVCLCIKLLNTIVSLFNAESPMQVAMSCIILLCAVVYVFIFVIEQDGVSAFKILYHNGVIEEKKPVADVETNLNHNE